MASGNPALAKKLEALGNDEQQLLSIQEQVQIKKLVTQLQTECRKLKREVAEANRDRSRGAAAHQAKKKVVGAAAPAAATRGRQTSAAVEWNDDGVSPRKDSETPVFTNPLRTPTGSSGKKKTGGRYSGKQIG